jgi:hypothetical protein
MAVAPKKTTKPKAVAKPKTSTSAPKVTPRGGPGAAGKNVSKTARQPGSSDRAYNAHKKAVEQARAQYKEVDRMYQSDPLGRLLTGNVNKYKKDFDKVEKNMKELKSNDKSFVKAGYKSQFVGLGSKPKKK